MMRIVQLANFHTPTSGGLRTVLDQLGRHYVAAGHHVVRVVPGQHDSVGDVNGVEEIRLRAPLVPGMGGYRAITNTRRVDQLLERLAPDVIELSDKTTLVGPARAQRRRGTAVVMISHERLDAILARRVPAFLPLTQLADRWNRRLIGAVDAVVCCSDFAAAEFDRISAPQLFRVPLGVDLQAFQPAADQPVDSSGPRRLIIVGRLSSEKEPEVAIAALRVLVERQIATELVVVGDGPIRLALERGSVGLPVQFLGHVGSRDVLSRLISNADVCIAPCEAETFGLAALEALACGTPVVVPAGGALAELVDGTIAGRVVARSAAGNRASWFADAIVDLLSTDRATACDAARRRAEQFTWSATSSAMLSLMENLVQRRGEGVSRRGSEYGFAAH